MKKEKLIAELDLSILSRATEVFNSLDEKELDVFLEDLCGLYLKSIKEMELKGFKNIEVTAHEHLFERYLFLKIEIYRIDGHDNEVRISEIIEFDSVDGYLDSINEEKADVKKGQHTFTLNAKT